MEAVPNNINLELAAEVEREKKSRNHVYTKHIKYIAIPGHRRACYHKRSRSLILAAKELQIQTGCKVMVVIQPSWPRGKSWSYCSDLPDVSPKRERRRRRHSSSSSSSSCPSSPTRSREEQRHSRKRDRGRSSSSSSSSVSRGRDRHRTKKKRRSSSPSSSSSSSFSGSSSDSSSNISSSSSQERRHKRKKATVTKKESKSKRKFKNHKKKSKRKKKKKSEEPPSGPVQLSKFIKERNKDVDDKRSIISGKKIKMKVKKSSKDKERDLNRRDLLNFLNSTM